MALADVIFDAALVAIGEPCFIVYVDRIRMTGQDIVATLSMNVTGPVPPEKILPRKPTGGELPVLEAMRFAQERARELGVAKILLVDPHGLLPLAKIEV